MRRTRSAFLIAVLGVLAAAALRLVLQAYADQRSLLLFVPPVLAAAALGGAAPALLATLLSVATALAADRLGGAAVDAPGLALFVAVGLGLALVAEGMMRERTRAVARSQELREREAHLQSILDTVPGAMIVIDERGLVQSFSAAAERLFGWAAPEVIGRSVDMLAPAPDGEAHDGHIARYLASGIPHVIGTARVVAGLRRDGATFPMELSVGEIGVGGRRFFTGFAHDLTERQAAEARLQALQSELAHVSRLTAMGEMAQALAHELNQPLSAIANYLRGATRLLEKGEPADRPRMAEALSKAGDQALRAGEVIRRLRDFIGRGESERRIESLSKLVEEASGLALVGVERLGVRLQTAFDPRADLVLADRVQIQQVVVNLLRNAVEAMGGAEVAELSVRATDRGDGFTVVSVSDTGPGLDEAVQGRLFEPFMTTKPDGMGVGLSICRTIVEAHGGAIWASNNEGAGATFAFTLPLAKVPVDA